MAHADDGRVTAGVFQDAAWASKGIDALLRIGLGSDILSVIAPASADSSALVERVFGTAAQSIEIAAVGTSIARGPLVPVLQGGADDLARLGLAGTMRRVGFQSHDARIFEMLTARGGVLVAVHSESRAADALASLHAYGGGNAAIGAWTGRV
jgi:hypothetical protein